MNWYDARRAEQDAKYAEANEQRVRVFPPNSTTANVAVYAAPAMYEGNDKMDYGTDYDRREDADTPASISTVLNNLDILANELERTHNSVDKLYSKLSPVLMPTPSASDGNKKAREASNSALADRLSSLIISVEDLNAKVRSLTETVDL